VSLSTATVSERFVFFSFSFLCQFVVLIYLACRNVLDLIVRRGNTTIL
jgi:hypothetical protein